MSIRTREELMALIKDRVGEDQSDEALAFIEDVNDTFADMEAKANGDKENWKQKYEENDKMWRERYRDRFFNSSSNEEEDLGDSEPPKTLTYDELFKEE